MFHWRVSYRFAVELPFVIRRVEAWLLQLGLFFFDGPLGQFLVGELFVARVRTLEAWPMNDAERLHLYPSPQGRRGGQVKFRCVNQGFSIS